MKTVKEHLATADREKLLNYLCSEYEIPLGEVQPDQSLLIIYSAYRERMNGFIDRLLEITPVPSDCRVVYLYNDHKMQEKLDVMDINDEIEMFGYSLKFPEWRVALGYLVADTPETQGNINVLLARVIEEVSAYGLDEREREAAIEEHFSGKPRGCISFDKPLAERIKEELVAEGCPVPEDDPVHDEYWYKMIEAIKEYE